jgi:hypothetical protein
LGGEQCRESGLKSGRAVWTSKSIIWTSKSGRPDSDSAHVIYEESIKARKRGNDRKPRANCGDERTDQNAGKPAVTVTPPMLLEATVKHLVCWLNEGDGTGSVPSPAILQMLNDMRPTTRLERLVKGKRLKQFKLPDSTGVHDATVPKVLNVFVTGATGAVAAFVNNSSSGNTQPHREASKWLMVVQWCVLSGPWFAKTLLSSTPVPQIFLQIKTTTSARRSKIRTCARRPY